MSKTTVWAGLVLLLALICTVMLPVSAESSNGNTGVSFQWIGTTPDEETLKNSIWEFDGEQIGEGEVILSISPSCKYILTAKRDRMDISMGNSINRLGWIVDNISLYTNQNGAYTLTCRVDMSVDAAPDLNDTLAVCDDDGVAWVGDEPRLFLTVGVNHIKSSYLAASSSIYFVDFLERSIVNLTGFDSAQESMPNGHLDLLPRCDNQGNLYFIRYEHGAEHMLIISLMRFNMTTGELRLALDLSEEGRRAFINDYKLFKDKVYYSLDAFRSEFSGLYRGDLHNNESSPVLLLSLADMREQYGHTGFSFFTSVQISPNGRLLCLSADDRYIHRRVIPAYNIVSLYDLESNLLIESFADKVLKEDSGIITAAAFAPDGNSLLCVLYDWPEGNNASLYQIRLDNGSFDTVRVYSTDFMFPAALSWHENHIIEISAVINSRSLGFVKLLIPGAVEQYADNGKTGFENKTIALCEMNTQVQNRESRSSHLYQGIIDGGGYQTIGLKSDGTVIVAGDLELYEANSWMDIIAVTSSFSSVFGLKADGTVVADGQKQGGEADVSDWTDIVSIAGGLEYNTAGLKGDGTVVVAGKNAYGQTDVSEWTGIVAVSAGAIHTVGLKADGTVIVAGDKDLQSGVSGWRDIVMIAAGGEHIVGLRADGTVTAIGRNNYGETDVDSWSDIVAVAAGYDHTVGLKEDGTLVAVGSNEYGQTDVDGWTDIVAIACGLYHTVGVKENGTVVAAGLNVNGQTDVGRWTDIGFR